MKKTILLMFILLIPAAFACDMSDHGNEITGAHISDTHDVGSGSMMSGFGMIGLGYFWLIIFLYFVIGLGYVIYKLNQIENKLRRKK